MILIRQKGMNIEHGDWKKLTQRLTRKSLHPSYTLESRVIHYETSLNTLLLSLPALITPSFPPFHWLRNALHCWLVNCLALQLGNLFHENKDISFAQHCMPPILTLGCASHEWGKLDILDKSR